MKEKLIARLHTAVKENGGYCDIGAKEQAAYSCGVVAGLGYALGEMGVVVWVAGDFVEGLGRITRLEVAERGKGPINPWEQPKQEREIPNTLYLFRPLAEFGEALKESCPPNDCIVYRNIYEMYCERLADYKRILATCPDLAEDTVRVLESSIYGLMKQLHDMWDTNIAVNRKREAMRHEKEQKARIAAKAME